MKWIISLRKVEYYPLNMTSVFMKRTRCSYCRGRGSDLSAFSRGDVTRRVNCRRAAASHLGEGSCWGHPSFQPLPVALLICYNFHRSVFYSELSSGGTHFSLPLVLLPCLNSWPVYFKPIRYIEFQYLLNAYLPDLR